MRYIVQPYIQLSRINPTLYGGFSEHLGRGIYQGIWVGINSPIDNERGIRSDVVEALKKVKLAMLRWPGGCFAERYHWQTGIGTPEQRQKMLNATWGSVIEDNSFGTHEFFDLCEQIGCEPYVCGNVGSGSVWEMDKWIEYMTMEGVSPMADARKANGRAEPWPLKYFGIGNENWWCGGHMRAEYYADQYKQYQTFARNYGNNKLYKIACGPVSEICGPREAGPNWTEVVMREAAPFMDGLSLHHYAMLDTDHLTSATVFTEEDYYQTLARAWYIDKMIRLHGGIMDQYDPDKRVGLIVDEWGTWYDVEPGTNPTFHYQQNTMRDAMVAALTLNVFNKHSDRVHAATIAQTVNVMQSLVLTEGKKMILTPTYHVFDMYKSHQGARLVQSATTCDLLAEKVPSISESASIQEDGLLTITVANLHASQSEEVAMRIDGGKYDYVGSECLSGEMHEHNSFEEPNAVASHRVNDIKCRYDEMGTEACFHLPACGVMALRFQRIS